MTFRHRLIRAAHPHEITQQLVMEASFGRQHFLMTGQDIHWVHFGEDGVLPVLVEIRGPVYIKCQMEVGVFQDWYCDEIMQDIYFEDDPRLETPRLF